MKETRKITVHCHFLNKLNYWKKPGENTQAASSKSFRWLSLICDLLNISQHANLSYKHNNYSFPFVPATIILNLCSEPLWCWSVLKGVQGVWTDSQWLSVDLASVCLTFCKTPGYTWYIVSVCLTFFETIALFFFANKTILYTGCILWYCQCCFMLGQTMLIGGQIGHCRLATFYHHHHHHNRNNSNRKHDSNHDLQMQNDVCII